MSYQYDRYLDKHREYVQKAFEWLVDNLPDVVDDIPELEWLANFAHDQSKFEPDEYAAYDAYFYGNNVSYAVMQEYRKAWLLHIHRNPHHWQHWILINDDPKEGEILLPMPVHYILEMICDWWSFSWASGNPHGIFKWYDEHKDYMKLHPDTRKRVEDILGRIKGKLEENATLSHHGVKGQKWGVRNGPPYPVDRPSGNDTIVRDAIESGQVSKTINREKQQRHTRDGHPPGRSYIDGDVEYAQKLVDKLSGTGTPLVNGKTGEWLHKEKVTSPHIIGTHVGLDGEKSKTNKAMISYSKTGTHIYPRKGDER